MSHISKQAIGSILDHIAAVIEGDGQRGIPGTYSADELLRASGGVTFAATGVTGATTIELDSATYAADRWTSTDGPGFWLVCTSAADQANVDAARKISAWDQATTTFTVAAFPANLSIADEFEILQGFKQLPNGIDIEGHLESGFDRSFRLEAEPGTVQPYYGMNTRTYLTQVTLRLRLLKHGRDRDIRRAAFENARCLVDAVTLRQNYEDIYTRSMDAVGSEVTLATDDDDKVVVEVSFQLQYRVQTNFK